MSEKSSGCGCCSECTGGPDCTCGCPDCVCGDCAYSYGECDCGESMFALSAVSSIVGMVLLGILAMIISVFYLNDAWNLTAIDMDAYQFLLLSVAGALLFAGLFSLKAGDVTEGILFALVGFVVFIVNVASFFFGIAEVPYVNWLLILIVVVVAIVLFASRDITFGIGVLLFVFALLFATAFDTELMPLVSGLMYFLSGIILLYVAISDWIFVETGADLPLL